MESAETSNYTVFFTVLVMQDMTVSEHAYEAIQ